MRPRRIAGGGSGVRDIALAGPQDAMGDIHAGGGQDPAQRGAPGGQADFEGLTAQPLPFGFAPQSLQPWLTGGAPLETVRGDKDVFGDGTVVMLAMPGHTPGSHALLVRLAQAGPVLLSGDAAIFREQLDTDTVPGFNTDRAQSLASMARLKAIAGTLPARLVIQHDPDDIPKLPAFPASAD
jgi:glyoxylase-like metal-dependent hydrolase (beta-lactamase superfamily II)